MTQQLVFVTNNKHKVQEVADKIGNEIKLLTLNDIGCLADIEEIGTTFKENASIKSRYVFEHYHMDCFGDDSGLEIDALNGEPGVYSARYSGQHGDHAANIAKVLAKMEGQTNRKARFKTVISLIWQGREYFFEGVVDGTITDKAVGNEGFGYDPVFQPEGYDITFAQMTMQEKNKISHRARAVEKLVAFLTSAA